MNTLPTPNIMLIGPTQAGKTTLLTALRLAAYRELSNGIKVEVHPISSEAKQLYQLSVNIVKTGSIVPPATNQASEYVFKLICPVDNKVHVEHYEEELPSGLSGLWKKPVKVPRHYYKMERTITEFTLTVLDGRGGHIFGERDEMEDKGDYERNRAKLVELATTSVALIVCINACDPNTTLAFFQDLQRFLDDVREKGNRIPFERVAIVLTQADRLVEQYGSSAQNELEGRDAACAACEAMGFYARSGLFQSLEEPTRKKVFAGFASVYGFIRQEGSVNFDSSTNRIAIFQENNAKWTDEWYPHGIVEPFLFACTGEPAGLKQVAYP